MGCSGSPFLFAPAPKYEDRARARISDFLNPDFLNRRPFADREAFADRKDCTGVRASMFLRPETAAQQLKQRDASNASGRNTAPS
jgi:hypothetical protein